MRFFPISIIAILLTNAIDFVGTPIVEPALPFYMTETMNATATQINSIAGVYSLTQMFFGTYLGSASDRVGRKYVLLCSLVGQAVFYIACAYCDSLLSMCIARGLLGVASANGAVAMAYIYDTVGDDHMLRAVIQWNSALKMSCGVLGLNIGAVLFALWKWHGVCFIMGGVCAAEALIGAMFWEGRCTRTKQEMDLEMDLDASRSIKSETTAKHAIFSHFCNARLFPLLLWQAGWLGSQMFQACLPYIFMDQYRLTQADFARFIGIWTLSSFVFTLAAQSELRIFGDKICMSAQSITSILCMLLILFGPRSPYVLCVLWLLPTFGAAQAMAFQQRLNKATPKECRGEVNGLSLSLRAGMSFVATIGGGLLFDFWPPAMYISCCFICVVRVFVVWLMLPDEVETRSSEPLLQAESAEPKKGDHPFVTVACKPESWLTRKQTIDFFDLNLCTRPHKESLCQDDDPACMNLILMDFETKEMSRKYKLLKFQEFRRQRSV